MHRLSDVLLQKLNTIVSWINWEKQMEGAGYTKENHSENFN